MTAEGENLREHKFTLFTFFLRASWLLGVKNCHIFLCLLIDICFFSGGSAVTHWVSQDLDTVSRVAYIRTKYQSLGCLFIICLRRRRRLRYGVESSVGRGMYQSIVNTKTKCNQRGIMKNMQSIAASAT